MIGVRVGRYEVVNPIGIAIPLSNVINHRLTSFISSSINNNDGLLTSWAGKIPIK